LTAHCAEFECGVPAEKLRKDSLDPVNLDRKYDLAVFLLTRAFNSGAQCWTATKDICDLRSLYCFS
jgi:hypothetical protein